MPLQAVPFSIRALLDETLNLVRLQAESKGLRLTGCVADEISTTLVADPGRLQQVLLNLVNNAIKFTEQGTVAVKIEQEQEDEETSTLHVQVSDTGIGIPEEKQAEIFDAFTQVDGSTTRKYGGTGLGLSIASQLVAMFQGRIWVESTPGQGTVMHFTARLAKPLPEQQVAPDESGLLPASPPLDAEALQKLQDAPKHLDDIPTQPSQFPSRILLAEDNSVNQRVATAWLQRWGHSVHCVSNGHLALDALQQETFDLALMDVQMPELDGLEATRRFRSIPTATARTLPIVALTAHAMETDRQRCLDAGMTHFLPKPLRPKALFELLEQLLAPAPPPSEHDLMDLPHPPADESSTSQVFDSAALWAHCAHSRELLKDIVQLFFDSYPKLLAEIEEALTQQQSEALAKAAHTLKGAVGNFCAPTAFQAALDMEMVGRDAAWDRGNSTWAALVQRLDELHVALNELLQEPSASPAERAAP